MNDIYLINGPIKLYLRQDCSCIWSSPIDMLEFSNTKGTFKEEYTITIVSHPYVCSVCKKPYKVQIDLSNITVIKNIGEPNEEEGTKEETNNSGD